MTDDDLKSALARLPVPKLDADRRRTLAAEVLARVDLHDDTRRRPSFVPYGVVAIAAAAVMVFVLGRDERGLGSRLEQRSVVAVESEPIAAPVASTHIGAPAFTSSAYTGSARVPDSPRRHEGDTKDTKVLAGGACALDPSTRSKTQPFVYLVSPWCLRGNSGTRATDRAAPSPTDLAAADRPRPGAGQPADTSVDIRRKQRQEFGATDNRQGPVIERETRDLEASTVAAFREGWEALRAGRYTDAIAAFDRATDPAVAEDATFWAAIAAQRAGNLADARKRLADFLVRFPDSPRADRAREVLR